LATIYAEDKEIDCSGHRIIEEAFFEGGEKVFMQKWY
jgi:hypothetical protein